MAYIGQEKKKEIAANLKPILKKYCVKGTLAIDHHSTLQLNISESPFNPFDNYIRDENNYSVNQGYHNVNPYWYQKQYAGKLLEFLTAALQVMNQGNHNNSDLSSDYFDVGWYVDIHFGRWDKPYKRI